MLDESEEEGATTSSFTNAHANAEQPISDMSAELSEMESTTKELNEEVIDEAEMIIRNHQMIQTPIPISIPMLPKLKFVVDEENKNEISYIRKHRKKIIYIGLISLYVVITLIGAIDLALK